MIDFRKHMGYYDSRYPALDATTPWYEFNSYLLACESLEITPSLQRFMRYQHYLKTIGVIK